MSWAVDGMQIALMCSETVGVTREKWCSERGERKFQTLGERINITAY
jgi:hypothetical protein